MLPVPGGRAARRGPLRRSFLDPVPCRTTVSSCLSLCDPVDCSPLGSSVREILQARTLERVAIPSSRALSPPTDGRLSNVACLVRQFLTTGVTCRWPLRSRHRARAPAHHFWAVRPTTHQAGPVTSHFTDRATEARSLERGTSYKEAEPESGLRLRDLDHS